MSEFGAAQVAVITGPELTCIVPLTEKLYGRLYAASSLKSGRYGSTWWQKRLSGLSTWLAVVVPDGIGALQVSYTRFCELTPPCSVPPLAKRAATVTSYPM